MEANLKIGGHTYRVQVQEGQENRLNAVAARVDSAIAAIRQSAGTNRMDRDRLLVLAALTVADTLYELESKQETEKKTLLSFHDSLAQRLETLGQRLTKA